MTFLRHFFQVQFFSVLFQFSVFGTVDLQKINELIRTFFQELSRCRKELFFKSLNCNKRRSLVLIWSFPKILPCNIAKFHISKTLTSIMTFKIIFALLYDSLHMYLWCSSPFKLQQQKLKLRTDTTARLSDPSHTKSLAMLESQ